MATMYYDNDADLQLIRKTPIAIIGFGSQGHAHALNLRDNGCDVRVGLYNGSKSWAKAQAAGLPVRTVEDATAESEIVMLLTPDIGQAEIYRDNIAPHLHAGKMLMFAHGFAIRFGQIHTEFSVKAITEGIDAVGNVTIRIEEAGQTPNDGADGRRHTYSGHGVHTDIIVAAAYAYMGALNKLLAARQTRIERHSAQYSRANVPIHAVDMFGNSSLGHQTP